MRALGAILIILFVLGCVQQTQNKVYVCPDGSEVSDPNLCELDSNNKVQETSAPITTEPPFETIDASKLDTYAIEARVFELVNMARAKEELEPYRKNDIIADIARQYSNKMVSTGFQHTDTEGKDVYDRLNENGIFYLIAGENLILSGALMSGTDENDVGKLIVGGWLKSPGHKSLVVDRDGLFSDAGIGVHCLENYCYATMIVVGLKLVVEDFVDSGHCYRYDLYNSEFPYDYEVPTKIKIDSPKTIDVWITADSKAFDYCVTETPTGIKYVKAYRNIKTIDEEITIERGYMLLIRTFRSHNISTTIDYDPGPHYVTGSNDKNR